MLFLSFFVLDIKFHFFLGEGLLGKKLLTTRSNLVDYTCKLNQRLMKDYKHQNTQLKFYNLICNIRCAVYPMSIASSWQLIYGYHKSTIKLPRELIFSSTFEEGLNRDREGLFNLTKCINRSKVSQGRTCVTGRYTAFSNNKKMVTILHRDLEHKVEKVRSAHEVGGHVAEDQKQYEFPA